MRNPLSLLILVVALAACDVAASSPAGGRRRTGYWHTVEQGETLSQIARQAYGDPFLWTYIQDANPWIVPEELETGRRVYVPAIDLPPTAGDENLFNADPPPAPPGSAGPAASGGDRGVGLTSVFANLVPRNIQDKTMFGRPVHTLSFIALVAVFSHAILQGFLLWVVATLAFVKDVTLKKALRATFHTEFITVFSALVLGSVILLMIHLGTTAPGAAPTTDVFQTMETYLRHPIGTVVAGLVILTLYVLLSLRFVPQIFELQRAQSMTLVFFGILLPHIMGLYAIGQRAGLIQL